MLMPNRHTMLEGCPRDAEVILMPVLEAFEY